MVLSTTMVKVVAFTVGGRTDHSLQYSLLPCPGVVSPSSSDYSLHPPEVTCTQVPQEGVLEVHRTRCSTIVLSTSSSMVWEVIRLPP